MDFTTNETSPDGDSKIVINVTYAVFIPILCILIITGNFGTIYAFWKLPELREKPSELLILSLACADLIPGLFVLPPISPLWITPGYWPFTEATCRMMMFFGDMAVIAGLFSLCAISLDRFLLVFKEYPQYMKIQTPRRIKTTLAIVWSLALMAGTIEISLWDVAKTLDDTASTIDYTKHCMSPARRMKSFAVIYFLIGFFLPVLTVRGFSATFFYLLHQRLTKSWGMRAESQLSTTNATAQQAMSSQQRKQYIKPAVVLLVLVSAMAICMLPYSTYLIVVEGFCPQCGDHDTLYLLVLLLYCNAALDPFLYAMTQKKIQRFYKARLKNMLVAKRTWGDFEEQQMKRITLSPKK